MPRHENAVPRNEMNIAINSAAEDVLAVARRDLRVPFVAHADGDHEFARRWVRGNRHLKTGVPAAMLARMMPVDEDIGDLENAIELKEEKRLLVSLQMLAVDSLSVPSDADIKLRRAEVGDIKAVGQPDRFPG